MARLLAFLPRLVVLTLVWLLLTAALTYAAGGRLAAAPPAAAPSAAVSVAKPTLVVPDVRGKAYVFAKGMLEDAGFAWKVTGKVHGYPANLVVSQTPAVGTRVLDTGAPTIRLRLSKGGYAQIGQAEDVSPYAGTAVRLADLARSTPPQAKRPAAAKPAAVETPAKAAAASPAKQTARPPAFTFAGQRPEPQHELPLPDRARKLDRWLAGKPKATDPNVAHWLYQHTWIVTGAKEGWWHGAEALRLLIGVDERAQALWGIGARSEAVARAALSEVEARSR